MRSNQTVKFAYARIARISGEKAYGVKVYTFSHQGHRPAMRAGTRKIGA